MNSNCLTDVNFDFMGKYYNNKIKFIKLASLFTLHNDCKFNELLARPEQPTGLVMSDQHETAGVGTDKPASQPAALLCSGWPS